MLNIRIAMLLASICAAGCVHAQERRLDPLADSSATRILAHVRSQGRDGFGTGLFVDVMRQRGKSQPKSKLDAIADSLTVEVIRKVRTSLSFAPDDRDAWSTLNALRSAGALRGISGTPYGGALDRMIRIYREVDPTSIVRSVLLPDLLCTSDFRRGLATVRGIILENEWTASRAMDKTIAVTMTGGQCSTPPTEVQLIQNMLRDLWEKRLAKGEAALSLAAHAGRLGWR